MQSIDRFLARQNLALPDQEDIAQTVMVRMIERLREPPTERAPIHVTAAFATGIARNVLREHRRIVQRREVLERDFATELVDMCGTATTPADIAYERSEAHSRVADAKRRLGEREQWLIEARFVEDISYAELLPRFNAVFGRSVRTEEGLRTATFHARSSLRLAFEREYVTA